MRLTEEEYRSIRQKRLQPIKPIKRPKYKNVTTIIDGIRFPSKKQAKRYGELRLLEKAGEIKDLRLEVSYPLPVQNLLICTYRADFVYFKIIPNSLLEQIVEDTKGFRTPVYRIKKKLMKSIYGIEILET